MTTLEMIENALLDAMGLLDEGETREFERAFASASSAVQAQVRREQTRLSHIQRLLPQVEPPADLRAAVIAAVRREMDLAAQDERRTDRSPIFTLLPAHRVSAGWRAAAIGVLTAAVVFGAATIDMRQTFSRIEAQLHTDSFLLEWPSEADKYIFDAGTRRVSFDRSDFSTPGEVVLWVKPETGEAFFYCKSLPWKLSGKKCELVAIDDEGVARQLADFMYEGKVISMEVKVQLEPGVRFAVREISSGPSADSMKVYTPRMRELNL